ncbi:MAG: bacteriohemerythrin [Halopseudomonas sp.]
MDRFQWKPAFCVGDDQVDGQHKKIFELLAGLHQAIHGDDADSAVKHTLKELLEYTKVHFSDEEELMRSIDYPEYDAHKALHDALMDKVWALYMRCNEGSSDLAFELLVFLNDWLVNHILEKDKAITAYVRQNKEQGQSR